MVWDGVMGGTYEDRLGRANDIMIFSNMYVVSARVSNVELDLMCNL
jgi:hypothetical protein